jgi:hypothetical protein
MVTFKYLATPKVNQNDIPYDIRRDYISEMLTTIQLAIFSSYRVIMQNYNITVLMQKNETLSLALREEY